MNHLFYDEWCQRRLNKLYGIFGKEWFGGKSILELGCGYGNIGIELTKLGAHVTFADARIEHLQTVTDKLKQYNYAPDCALIDQNVYWNFDKKFDMIIHFGVLYHLTNWKEDLKNSLRHTNLLFLESSVWPGQNKPSSYNSSNGLFESVNGIEPRFTQEDVEEKLSELDCKFLRIDDSSLNVNWSWYSNTMIRCVYDWTYEKYESGLYQYKGNHVYDVHYKRLWMVMK